MRYLFGLMLCTLLFGFAIGAKTALYQTNQQELLSLTATKVWQDESVPTVLPAAAIQTAAVLSITLLLLFSLEFSGGKMDGVARDEPAIFLSMWLQPFVTVRPPPTV